ncbi:hypothetical protein LCGC14_1554580 [marine sediment metagenome]|uniref:Uncharacterized protein n=1 Tax=marine sediment metagenome TaxID=412755 RepID=A0A0F9LQ17_9ZZZZ
MIKKILLWFGFSAFALVALFVLGCYVAAIITCAPTAPLLGTVLLVAIGIVAFPSIAYSLVKLGDCIKEA